MPMPLPHLLLSAYSLDPDQGSERTVGWNRTVQAARFGKVWVLTEDLEHHERIAARLVALGIADRVQMRYIAHTPFEQRLAKKGAFYVSYARWQRRALELAEALHEEVRFDLIHHANMVGFREPGFLYKLALEHGIPFILGPIGGTQNYPEAFLWRLGRGPGVKETIRTALNRFQLRHSPRFHEALRAADVVMAANSQGQHDLREIGIEADLLLETGISRIGTPRQWADRRPGPLRILWAGETIFRKAVDLMVDAFMELRASGTDADLTILGDGPYSHLIPDHPQIHAPGWVSHADALAAYADADVFAFTSLRDTSGNVVLEALANGLPLVYLDHQGARDMGSADCGIPVAVTHPEQSIADLAAALRQLASEPERYDALSRGAIERAHHFDWTHNGDRMNAVYARVLIAPSLRRRRRVFRTPRPVLPLAARPAPWL